FFAGSAAAVKYLGLFFVVWLGVEALLRAGRGRRLRAAALYVALALAALLPAYARITLRTGNPVFPYAAGLFGESAWSTPIAPGDLPRSDAAAALVRRYARLPLLPWDLVFERQRANRQPPLSPLYLLALPALAWGVARRPRVRRLLLPAAAYAAVFPLLPPDARYLVPVLPLASLATAEALLPLVERAAPRRRAALAALLAACCFLPGWLYAGWRIARQGTPPLTAAARESYLARALPAYSALRFLDRRHGNDYTVYALHAENSTYYARGRFLGDWLGSAAFGEVLPLVSDPAAFHARLRAMGADHLLLVRGWDYGLGADPAFRRLFLEVYADRHARLFRLAGG
ncbi:MAG TPA: hypothetical protein VGC93_07030, partial [Thermoanaerobaculia bacterium]